MEKRKELKTLRYETLQPLVLESAPERFWDVMLPACSPEARILRVERDGRALVLDCGVPVPECDLQKGEVDWGEVHWIDLRAVLHADTRVIVLPQEPGRYLGFIRNAIGLWTVFERRRRTPTVAPPAKSAEPLHTAPSATRSALF